jgi:hypothetical protein
LCFDGWWLFDCFFICWMVGFLDLLTHSQLSCVWA